MKKVVLLFLFFIILGFSSCSQQVPCVLEIINDDNTITNYEVSKTEDKQIIKEVLNKFADVKTNVSSFNGVKVVSKGNISGAVNILKDNKETNIKLDYETSLNLTINLKDYLLEGSIEIDGKDETESDSLYLKQKNNLSAELHNDDEFIYLDGILKFNNNKIMTKRKVDISSFTSQYKLLISTYVDLIKYYNITSFIKDIDKFVDDYNVIIASTTKKSIIFRLEIDNVNSDLNFTNGLYIYVEVASSTLLPISIQIEADDLIKEILESEYLNKYANAQIIVSNAKFKTELTIEYGNYSVEPLTQEEKEQFELIDISKLL